ncbi:MAG: DUF4197 domain-containing protein [Bacteroidia bacterium]
MIKKILLPSVVLISALIGCTSKQLQDTANAAKDAINSSTKPAATPLTNEEVISGLRDALTVGTNNSTAFASKVDGFYKNPSLFIPFPPEAQKVKDWAIKFGMQEQVDKFTMTLNRSAEEAAKDAGPVFVNAIKGMSISDGFAILKGADNAATEYLKDKTSTELRQKFTPVVQNAINKVELTKYWNPIITGYNKVPFVEKQNPDLTAYVTDRAMQGLFKLIQDEELKIRKDPVARVTDILKKVFGSLTQ